MIDKLRQSIIDEAKSWIKTPFHHEGRIKKVGTDCGMLILEIFAKVGLLPKIEVPHYPLDFMLHRNEEWYLLTVLKYGHEIQGPPLPGDIILFRHGRLFSHGGIVIEWPRIIHASSEDGCVCYGDVGRPPLSTRKHRFFRHNIFKNENK